jgi:epoxyqueuosine reductase QueG/ribosomal protein S18 acetylase RimI-like enzyme
MRALNAEITKRLKDHGADLVGFADVSCLPAEVTGGLTRAVSIALALDPAVIRAIQDGPTVAYFAEYERANLRLAQLSEEAAHALTGAGHRALPFPPTTEQIDRATLSAKLQHRTVATRAGLGWIGKSGLLITREYGSAVRLASVLTDAELETGRPVDVSSCGNCHQCVDHCPAQAIAGVHWQAGATRERIYNPAACFKTAKILSSAQGIRGTICGVCINVCPWTQRYLARKTGKPDRVPENGWQPQAQLGDGVTCERECACNQSPTIPKASGLEAATRRVPASNSRMEFQVASATTEDLDTVRALFREYEASLSFDLCFQNFEQEVAGLPGRYAPPSGQMLLAKCGSAVVGCVALRQIGEGTCEMKRLFIQPAFRGKGIGKALARAIIEEGRRIGYKSMRLDTAMEPARSLYRSLGFREIPPYQHVPVEGVVFM